MDWGRQGLQLDQLLLMLSAALFNSLVARSGTFTVNGSKIVIHYDASEGQSITNTERRYSAEVDGNRLTLTSSPFVRPKTGEQVISILTFDRAE
jgi:hypothetical protein